MRPTRSSPSRCGCDTGLSVIKVKFLGAAAQTIIVPVLALTQNEEASFCCSWCPAPAASSGTQDPRPLPLSPGGAGRTDGTDGCHTCPLFATCRVLGLRGGLRVQNKPDMVYGSHETRPPSSRGRAGGRGSPGVGRRPVTPRGISGRPLERNRHCHQTGTGSATSLCHPCHLRVAQFRMFTGKQGSS